MSIDDPNTTESTRDQLLTLNAALRLRLDMAVSALLTAAYQLDGIMSLCLDGEEAVDELRAARDKAHAAVWLARGETTDIPRSLLKDMSPQRQATAAQLLAATVDG